MQAIYGWITDPAHAFYFWFALSALLNLLFRIHSAGEWVAYAEKNPKLAFLAGVLRSIGLDPVGVLEAFVALVSSKAKPGKAGFARVRLLVTMAVVSAALVVLSATARRPTAAPVEEVAAGCAWFASHPSVAPDTVESGACVAEHALKGETLSQIAVACSLTVEKVLFDILASKDPNVQASAGFKEAMHLKLSLAKGDAGP